MIIADTYLLVKDPVVFHGWEDSQVPAASQRVGVTAPTYEGGFKGDANQYVLNFVHNQADEILFTVQIPHSRKMNSLIFPHCHISPFESTGAGAHAAQFIFKYYIASIDAAFGSVQTVTMTKAWSGEGQWYHYVAEPAAGISLDTEISSILVGRLYRDNTVTNNFAGKITLLSFDIHYQTDTYGSRLESTK